MNYLRQGSSWLSALLLIALVYSNHAQAATSDSFNTGTLDSKWTFYDPLANSTLSMTGTQASISVQAGSAHDLWTNALNAPRVRQAANNSDFDAVVKLDSTVSLRYQMQGITAEQDNANLVRFNVQSDGTRLRLFSASIVNGTATQRISTTITSVPPYLRVQRVGNRWTFSHSTNGSAWTIAGSYSHTLTVSSLGLFSGNAGSPVPAHTTLFDSFIVDGVPPQNTSDTTPPTISNIQASGITASGATITWTTNEVANSVMNYGLTAGYGTNSSDLAFVTAHSLTISGLTPNTLYHYRVWSSDASGNAVISTDQTFTTTSAVTQQNSIINWTRLSSSTGDLPVPPASNGQSGFKVVDLDNNGQIDYILTLWDAPETIVWYRHLGNTYEKYVIDTEKKGISHSDKFNDIDGDGDLDLIIGDASNANTINWWENPSPNYNPTVPWTRREVRNIGPNFYHDSIWGDFDGDGSEEYIAWNQFGQQLLMFEVPPDPKTSGPWPVTQIYTWPAGGGNARFRGSDAIDINLDGKIDFVGGCSWFEHTGGTNFVRHPIDDAHGYSSVEAGQLITGGRPEVICLKELENAPLNMYEWTGTNWRIRTLIPLLSRGHTLQIDDINGDGNLDIMVSEQAKWAALTAPTNNPDAKLLVLYGDGSGNFSAQTVSKGQGYLEGQLSDIDNDGDLDLITPPFRHNIPRIDMWINQGKLAGGDVTPPVISAPQIAITDTTAKISWSTDEISNSSINFGLTAGYGSNHVNPVRALSHSMALTNLLPNTTYNYQLSSVDGSGNLVRSPNFIFTTLANRGNPSGLASDHFTGPLNTGRWAFYDPIGNSTVSTNGTRASISMPAGSVHDLWTNALNAPRIRQAANNSDFTVEIKLDSALTAGAQQHGFTIEQDNKNLIRFDSFYNGTETRIFSASFVNGLPTTRVNRIISNSAPLYLRVNRTGNQWTMSYSYNGSDWTVAVAYAHTMAVSSVGIFGGNAGSARPAFSALVDYFLVLD